MYCLEFLAYFIRNNERKALNMRYSLIDKNIKNITIGHENLIIEKILGMGGTCIVYSVIRKEEYDSHEIQHRMVLKEFYPLIDGVESELEECRKSDGSIEFKDYLKENDRFKKCFKRFNNSYEIMVSLNNNLNSEDIVCGTNIFRENGSVYQLITYSAGCTIQEKFFDTDTSYFYEYIDSLEKIVAAVERLHASGFLHMDIKPENIFITPNGNIK